MESLKEWEGQGEAEAKGDEPLHRITSSVVKKLFDDDVMIQALHYEEFYETWKKQCVEDPDRKVAMAFLKPMEEPGDSGTGINGKTCKHEDAGEGAKELCMLPISFDTTEGRENEFGYNGNANPRSKCSADDYQFCSKGGNMITFSNMYAYGWMSSLGWIQDLGDPIADAMKHVTPMMDHMDWGESIAKHVSSAKVEEEQMNKGVANDVVALAQLERDLQALQSLM
jgi:hypothetical protein